MVNGRRSPSPRPHALATNLTAAWEWRGRRLGCAGLVSVGLHLAGALLLTGVVLRVSTAPPPIRVFLRAPAGPVGAPAAQEPGPAASVAAPVPAPAPAPVRAAKALVRRLARHSIKSSPPVAALPAAPAGAQDDTGMAAATSVGTGGAGRTGVGGGDGSGTAQPTSADPVLISQVLPQYPPLARLRGIEGQVVLQAIVTPDGRIEPDVKVVESVPLLDNAAIAALRQWRFRPARDRSGMPMRVSLRVPVRFVLR